MEREFTHTLKQKIILSINYLLDNNNKILMIDYLEM
jgi:hypothetical protein